jgi:hypothetical protein
MNPIYEQALNGTLCSPATGTPVVLSGSTTPATIQVYNKLACPILGFFLDSSGKRNPLGIIKPGQNASLAGALIGDYYVATVPASGAFICVITIVAGVASYTVDNSVLVAPNDIGPLPEPNSTILVPQNSPRVLVACANLVPPAKPVTNYVTREQYWCLQGDSYSIAPDETRTISFTVNAGKQETSSEQATVDASLGASASASGGMPGWGSASASISASLNASASVFQQVTVTEQTSTYVSDVVTNNTTGTNLVLRWQISDILTVFNVDGAPLSTISSGSVVMAQVTPFSQLKPATPTPQLVPRVPAPSLGESMPNVG